MKVIIIGGVAGGASCAARLRRLDEQAEILMVERGPFLEQGGGRSAYVLDGSSAVRHPISTGTSSLDAVEITGGLKAGDRVVVSGSDLFGDAERVRISGNTTPTPP